MKRPRRLFAILALAVLALPGPAFAATERKNYPPVVITPLAFNGYPIPASKKDLALLETRNVYMGDNDPSIKGVGLAKNFGKRKVATTCRRYFSLKNKGYDPQNTFDITMESFFIQDCGILAFLEKSASSQNSNFTTPPYRMNELENLPPELWDAEPHEDDYEICPRAANMKECMGNDNAQRRSIHVDPRTGETKIEDESGSYDFMPLAKGDFNRDGWEDLLVNRTYYVNQGSFRSFKNFCLEWKDRGKSASVFNCDLLNAK